MIRGGKGQEIDLRKYKSPALEEHYSPEVLRKAWKVGEFGRKLTPIDGDRGAWLVGSISSEKLYTVLVDPNDAEDPEDPIPTRLRCNCPNGRNSSLARCYHSAAVLIAKGYGLLN